MDKHVGQRGYAGLIGILIVLVILLYLTSMYFEKGTNGSPSNYKSAIGAAQRVECLENEKNFETALAAWSISHPGKPMDNDSLENAIPPVAIPKCPSGGKITVTADGHVYCSIHNPPPVDVTPTPPSAADLQSASPPVQGFPPATIGNYPAAAGASK